MGLLAKACAISAALVLLGALASPAWSRARVEIVKVVVVGPGEDPGEVEFGQDVMFEITVTNTGTVILENVLVADGNAPDCGGYLDSKDGPTDLVVGASFKYTCVVRNVQTGFVNRATASGNFQSGTQCVLGRSRRGSERVSVTVRNNPDIDIRKQAEGSDTRTFPSGSTVPFDIVVTNTGELPLTNVIVTDPRVLDCEETIGDLAAGESFTYTCEQPNVTSLLRNRAFVTGQAAALANCEVSDRDPSRVEVQGFECSIMVNKEVFPRTIIPTTPPNCESIDGRPTNLIFKFTGGGCAASENTQDPDKSNCTGSVDPGESATVVAAGGRNFDKPYSVAGSPVLPGGTFTVTGAFEAQSEIEISNGGGTEVNEIHTSCSQPLEVGNVFGSLTVVAINGEFGTSDEVTYTYEVTNTGDSAQVTLVDDQLGQVLDIFMGRGDFEIVDVTTEILTTTTNIVVATAVLDIPGDIRCDSSASAMVTVEEPPVPPGSCADGKPTALVFEYTGESCTASTNPQGGKFECSLDPAGTEPVQVVMTRDVNDITVTPDAETIDVGDFFTISRNTGDNFRAETEFDVRQGGVTLQSLNVHTSCSQDLTVGDQFGSLILREFIPE